MKKLVFLSIIYFLFTSCSDEKNESIQQNIAVCHIKLLMEVQLIEVQNLYRKMMRLL